MNVSLTPELEKLVNEKVESGMYASASEVIREGLRLLVERDARNRQRSEQLMREIAVGLEELDRGEGIPLTRETIEGIKQEGRRRLEAQREERKSA